MKKVIAVVLAAAAVFSDSAPVFAAETKQMTKPGTVEYEVAARLPEIVLNVALPAEIKAALNPYGNDFQLNDLNTIHTQNGIVSVPYPVYNYNTDYGFFLDAKAITSTSSGKWSVTKTPVTPGVKGANMCFLASKTEEGIAAYSNVSKAATSVDDQGCLPLDSTVPADRAKGISKGQTSQSKVGYVPASADGETPNIIYIGFAGMLADDSATTPVNWTESDNINVSLILKLTPAPKTL